MTVAEHLELHRRQTGRSMREIAEVVGLSHMTVSNAARGMPVSPRTERLLLALSVRLDAILGRRARAHLADCKVEGVVAHVCGRWSHHSQRHDARVAGVMAGSRGAIVRAESWRAGRWQGSTWVHVPDIRLLEVLA